MENDYLQSQSQYRLIYNPLILKKRQVSNQLADAGPGQNTGAQEVCSSPGGRGF